MKEFFKKSITAYLAPIGVFLLSSVSLVFMFLEIERVISVNVIAIRQIEFMLSFSIFSAFLLTWYGVMAVYEKNKGVAVRKHLKIFFKFMIVVYLLVLLRFLYETLFDIL